MTEYMDTVAAEPFETLREAVRSVECPRCHARPGQPCGSPSHAQSQAHTARWREARRVKAVIEVPCVPGCANH